MIGKLSGVDVPACGFSIGFERIVDLVEVGHGSVEQVAIIYDRAVDWGGCSACSKSGSPGDTSLG